jgi:hypothetical protein
MEPTTAAHTDWVFVLLLGVLSLIALAIFVSFVITKWGEDPPDPKNFLLIGVLCLPFLGQAQTTWTCKIQTPEHDMPERTVYNVDIFSAEGIVQIKWDDTKVIAHLSDRNCQSLGFTPTDEWVSPSNQIYSFSAHQMVPTFYKVWTDYQLVVYTDECNDPHTYMLKQTTHDGQTTSYTFVKTE